MKCLGAQWLVELMDHLAESGFLASGISPSIDAGKPVMVSEVNNDSDSTDDPESMYETDDWEDI